jgi:hypothetical protein
MEVLARAGGAWHIHALMGSPLSVPPPPKSTSFDAYNLIHTPIFGRAATRRRIRVSRVVSRLPAFLETL